MARDELQLEQEMEGEAHAPATATVDPTEAWKREQWERLGYTPDESVLLAALPWHELDYHDAENLIDRGCSRERALEILR